MSDTISITITQQENYAFLVDFGAGLPPLLADEPEPLGDGYRVTLSLGCAGSELEHLDRVLAQFEDFCSVSQSVRTGIPIHVKVNDGAGQSLK